MDDDTSLRTDDLLFWVASLSQGRADVAEPTLRKIVVRVGRLARAMLRKFPRVERFVEADDVVQNSMIRLLAAFRQVRPTSTRHFYALANELIRRELLDLTQRYYAAGGPGTNLSGAAVGTGGLDPAAPDVSDLDHLAAFHEAVERLPAEEREAFGLTYYHGWAQQPIADLFGVTVRTVQRRLEAAVARIQAEVGPP